MKQNAVLMSRLESLELQRVKDKQAMASLTCTLASQHARIQTLEQQQQRQLESVDADAGMMLRKVKDLEWQLQVVQRRLDAQSTLITSPFMNTSCTSSPLVLPLQHHQGMKPGHRQSGDVVGKSGRGPSNDGNDDRDGRDDGDAVVDLKAFAQKSPLFTNGRPRQRHLFSDSENGYLPFPAEQPQQPDIGMMMMTANMANDENIDPVQISFKEKDDEDDAGQVGQDEREEGHSVVRASSRLVLGELNSAMASITRSVHLDSPPPLPFQDLQKRKKSGHSRKTVSPITVEFSRQVFATVFGWLQAASAAECAQDSSRAVSLLTSAAAIGLSPQDALLVELVCKHPASVAATRLVSNLDAGERPLPRTTTVSPMQVVMEHIASLQLTTLIATSVQTTATPATATTMMTQLHVMRSQEEIKELLASCCSSSAVSASFATLGSEEHSTLFTERFSMFSSAAANQRLAIGFYAMHCCVEALVRDGKCSEKRAIFPGFSGHSHSELELELELGSSSSSSSIVTVFPGIDSFPPTAPQRARIQRL
eukprot:ANDGO_01755.mRNA.1 hypothetical protein